MGRKQNKKGVSGTKGKAKKGTNKGSHNNETGSKTTKSTRDTDIPLIPILLFFTLRWALKVHDVSMVIFGCESEEENKMFLSQAMCSC